MIDSLLGTLAPHHCFGCGKTGSVLCQDCKNNISTDEFAGCIVCRRPARSGVCSSCKTSYEKAWCVGERDDVLQALIDAYKFARVKSTARTLASLLDVMLPVLPKDAVVVAVPTISKHIRQRGYDHIALVAKEFARKRKQRFETPLRRVNKASQRELTRRDRFKEAERAFRCRSTLEDVPYLLIDDVVTTGATIQYCSQALMDVGAQNVWVAVIARQPLDKQG